MRSLQDHFLIAMPAMEDPNFSATVTYLCKHDEAGEPHRSRLSNACRTWL